MKLIFRLIQSKDLEMILKWRTSPEVTKYMYTDIEFNLDTQKIWYDNIRQDSTRMDWIINVDNDDVGLISIVKIDNHNKRCEWAYYLGTSSVRGKGVGKAVELNVLKFVFENLDLNKLCCEVYKSNDMVIKLHEKFGSIVEGVRAKHIYKNSKFHDIVEMGILKDVWKEKIDGKFEYVQGIFEPKEV